MEQTLIPSPHDLRLLERLQNVCGPYDGHTHTTRSDGRKTPEELCRQARLQGLCHIAITDHDHHLSWALALWLSLRFGLNVIPGVELNALHTVDGHRALTHLGLLWPPEGDKEFDQLLLHNQNFPNDIYVKAMLERLLRLGIDPSGRGVEASYQMLEENNPDCLYQGKGTLAQLLVDTGHASSRAEVSYLYIGEHGERRAYVAKEDLYEFVLMEQFLSVIARINRERDTASVVTLNHPFHYLLPEPVMEHLVRDAARMGCHAVEVFYPKHDTQREQLLLGWCAKYHLVPNIGSDYHYDAHRLALGRHKLFDNIIRLHRKEAVQPGKEY